MFKKKENEYAGRKKTSIKIISKMEMFLKILRNSNSRAQISVARKQN